MGKQFNIAILGLGVVATGVIEELLAAKEKIQEISAVDVNITKVLVRSKEKKQEQARKYNLNFETNIEKILNDPTIDLVIELIGGIHPAKEWILQALEQKKHVITANKDLIAQYGDELTSSAEKNQVSLLYEASVAGGIPILRNLNQHFLTDKVTAFEGILNGTSNYMLTQMAQEGMTFDESLQQAQALGFAESDPTNDVDGFDVAYKLMILIRLAFKVKVALKDLKIQGIRSITTKDIYQARVFGYRIKLIAQASQTSKGTIAQVAPKLMAEKNPLATVDNEMNAVCLHSQYLGTSMFYGPGAGSLPTAASVMNDLLAILQADFKEVPVQMSRSSLAAAEIITAEKTSYYISYTGKTDIRSFLDKDPLHFYSQAEDIYLITAKMTTAEINEFLEKVQNSGKINQKLEIMEG